MSAHTVIYRGGSIFDGQSILDDHCVVVQGGLVKGIIPEPANTETASVVNLNGDILSPGFVDLQVNGGDGIMLNDDPSVETLRRMANAHRTLGATTILPTLITDTREKTRAAIAAVTEAIANGVPGIAGLHLEGPHLSVARKGAHDAGLIRPMTSEDLALLVDAAKSLPVLMVTVAPETTTTAQVSALARVGAIVSLGHTDAAFDTCRAYAAAGARVVTHLFNAMSQLGNRDPGLVGAALDTPGLSAGLIADAIHVHPASMRAAWAAKTGPGKIFLVSDAMAPAGSEIAQFHLGDRLIRRNDGRLTLEDGTLAGADLDLGTAIRVLVEKTGIPLEQALRAATSIPADVAVLGRGIGRLVPGASCSMIRISRDFRASPA
ncbi:N-acetylglucosamine-6-phosphate deacetylase [Silicimonas sp. MF1-12-2]|uniref:N-acetylglucosamine-6-phosphate deacetylase n=1 Tax=Silicimonas sp. MF1-12-2 TaxID=3384793 RepID=UPI0039B39190